MRTGISFTVSPADQVRLEAIVADRNRPQKHVWRCRIVLLTAAGLGTNAIRSSFASPTSSRPRSRPARSSTSTGALTHGARSLHSAKRSLTQGARRAARAVPAGRRLPPEGRALGGGAVSGADLARIAEQRITKGSFLTICMIQQ